MGYRPPNIFSPHCLSNLFCYALRPKKTAVFSKVTSSGRGASFVKQKIEEKERLEEEIQNGGAILEGKNVDIQTVDEYKKLEEELKEHGLSTRDPRILVWLLQ